MTGWARACGAVGLALAVLVAGVGEARAQGTSARVEGGASAVQEAERLNDEVMRLYGEGKYARAMPLAERALSLREGALGPGHPDVATSLNNLAVLYEAQGAYAKAEPLLLRALAAREKALDPEHPDTAQSLNNLAALHWARGERRPTLALLARAASAHERFLRTGIGALSPSRQRQLLAMRRGEVEMTISFHAHDAPDEAALRLAVAAALGHKGRVLDELAGARKTLRQNLTPTLQDEFDALALKQAELATLREAARPEQVEARRALEDEVDQREAELGRKSAAFRITVAPITIERVQAALPEGAALVEFVRYDRFDPKGAHRRWKEARYVAYVLRHEGSPRWAPLGEAEPIEQAGRAARTALASPTADVRGPLRELDARLLAPLRRALGGELPAHLLLAPDGPLHTVPFGALIDEGGRHLLERSLVTYLGSGRDLLRMGTRLAPRSGPLVLAAHDFGPAAGPFAPLPGALAEAEAVRALFLEARVLAGASATRQALLAARGPRFALLSTHGFLRHTGLPTQPEAPTPPAPRPRGRGLSLEFAPPDEAGGPEVALERAGLALAGANVQPEGVVRGHDLAALDLAGTKLVVLSACETGLGQLQDGEGVYGLRRALAVAGAEAQVVSLWSVSDASTAELMGAYFGALRGGVGRSEALRRAQLGLLRQDRYRHPFYWAAFVASGDWRPLEGEAAVPTVRRGGACACRAAGADSVASGSGTMALALLGAAGCLRHRARRAARSARVRVGQPGRERLGLEVEHHVAQPFGPQPPQPRE